MSRSGQRITLQALTPLTNTDSSPPPGKLASPRSTRSSYDTMHKSTASRAAPSSAPANGTDTITPINTPPETRISIFPSDGVLGQRITYDPLLDSKLDKKARQSRPPTYKQILDKGDPSPPPDPRLAIAGYSTGAYAIKTVGPAAPKTKLRLAPYIAKPYSFDSRISCGPGPATQVVVTGFDPLTADAQLRGFFSTYGEVEKLQNQVHPDNGSPLGICLIKFRDSAPMRNVPAIKASTAAKRAEKEGTGQRIGTGTHPVRVHTDREGRRCAKLVDMAVQQTRKEQDKLRAKLAVQSAKALTPSTPASFDLPANVPKGPSGKGARPPPPMSMPREPLSRKAALSYLIEREPIKPTMKRTPYLFIAHQYVPVLATTIDHLKRRLKAFKWSAVRCDQTGYYVTFEESKRGEDETVRCFRECHMQALFTYVMNMECNQYGDPQYERSPSPERVLADKKRKAIEERIAEEEAADLELEKKQRADSLDPVLAALDQLKHELSEKLLGDIKSRIAGPALLDIMSSERQAAKRRKLNIQDPQTKENNMLTPILDPFAAATPKGRNGGFAAGRNRNALGPLDRNRRGKRPLRPVNAFADERRKASAPKPKIARGLHRQMLEMFEPAEESDDEGRSTLTRGTEEQESRPISRAHSTDVEDEEESSRAHRAKRRRIETGWGEDSDEEMDDTHARSLLAHCIHKDPENMAEKELEQVLAILPRSSPIWKKADKALKGFRRLRKIEQEADAIFGVETPPEDKLEPTVVITNEEDEESKPIETTEKETPAPTKKATTKPKKKTKKQIDEEVKAAKAEVKEEVAEVADAVEEELAEVKKSEIVTEVSIAEETPEEDDCSSVYWGVSSDEPRKTVEDDLSVVMDIDGWQHMLKDEEDLRNLKIAMQSIDAAKIQDAQSWAWKQKSIKHLNNSGEAGVSRKETKIEGYYLPNSTGSARTEGIKKIRESEKSKYLPHRIRVVKEREERQRRAKQEDKSVISVEGFKFTTGSHKTSTANSRANRANNRRMVNDINISKVSGADGDALRFNQLKKRKKLVKFDRSAIHNWGLYAEENIVANDMIIEYVGDRVRQRVADLREAKYDMQGVGSSYLFRIDEDTVIDATKMGGIARFINHSCTPNCTAKIIRVDNSKRIVIYALRDIGKDEELTYDYKFEREMDATDRIPCLCGSIGCKGFLN
ncbi:histone methyltransferase set1 [Didymella pomorum]